MLISNYLFSQSGQKYATGGNILSNGDRLGSNNSEDLVFVTFGIEGMRLTKNGLFEIAKDFRIKSFSNSNPGLLTYNYNGHI